jgi:hypothetical protein
MFDWLTFMKLAARDILAAEALGYNPNVSGSSPDAVIECHQFIYLGFTQPLIKVSGRERKGVLRSTTFPVGETGKLSGICEQSLQTI